MKDELPQEPESQDQNTSADSYNTFGTSSNNKAAEPFVSSAPITSVGPLVDSEVEPSTSDIASGNETFKPQAAAFSSEPITQASDTPSDDTQSAPVSTASDSSVSEPTPPVVPIASAPLNQFGSEPVAATTPAFGGAPVPPKSSKKKKFIIIGALVGVFALLGGGSVAAYNLWYQNPDKVLGDALVNALKAKTVTYTGSFDIDYKGAGASNDETRISVKVDGKNIGNAGEVNIAVETAFEGENFKISGSGLMDKDANIYVKVNDVKKLLRSLPAESGMKYDQLPQYITKIVDKVDSKWIRISADDIREFSDDYAKKQTCVEDVFKKLQEDKELSKELLNVYKDNKFIIIDEKLPAKNGSLGYVVDVDTNISKDFAKAADKTKFGKELQKCDDSFKFSSNSSSSSRSSSDDSDTKTRVEVWVDRWSHQLTKMSLGIEDDQADGMLVFEPKFNQPVTVDAPKDFIPLKDLKKDIEDAYAQYMIQMNMTSDLGNTSLRESAIMTYKSNNRGKEPTEAEIQQYLQQIQDGSYSAEQTL